MRFPMPRYPCYFEIPDEWLAGLGVGERRQAGKTYDTTSLAEPIPLTLIQPPIRSLSCPIDGYGFSQARFRHVLHRMMFGFSLDAVRLTDLPQPDWPPQAYSFSVENGYHRYYAAIVAGFEYLPRLLEP